MATRKSSCNCGQLSLTYEGPDPARISLCQCYECQKRTGIVLSAQTRLPIEHVMIKANPRRGRFPATAGSQSSSAPATVRGPRITSVLSAVRPCTGSFPSLRASSGPESAASSIRLSAADNFQLRSLRACVGDERLGPSDAAS